MKQAIKTQRGLVQCKAATHPNFSKLFCKILLIGVLKSINVGAYVSKNT